MKKFISDLLNRIFGYKQHFVSAEIFVINDDLKERFNLSRVFTTRRLYYPDIHMCFEAFKSIINKEMPECEIISIDFICIHRINGTKKYKNVDKSVWDE